MTSISELQQLAGILSEARDPRFTNTPSTNCDILAQDIDELIVQLNAAKDRQLRKVKDPQFADKWGIQGNLIHAKEVLQEIIDFLQ